MNEPKALLAQYLCQVKAGGEDALVLDKAALRRGGTAERRKGGRDEERSAEPLRRSDPPPRRSDDSTALPPYRRTARRGGGVRRKDWRDGAPAIPEPGIVIPPPSSDLFTTDDLGRLDLTEIASRVAACSSCRLCEHRANAVPGEGPADAKLVVVGEGPGATEDETGRPFVGRAGELLTDVLQAIELPREQVFICNIVKCRPPDNRKPQQDEIDACVPYLYRQLEVINPKVIIAVGGTAAETLLGVRRSLASLRNRVHSFRGTPLVVTYHPAALLRNPNWKKPTWDDVRIARQLLDQ